jgi:hypothetical protein
MKTFIADIEHNGKEVFDKWSGLFPTTKSYNQVISCDEDYQVVSPVRNIYGEYEPFLICIKDRYKGKDYQEIKKTLLSIDETTTLRANCSGPVNKKKIEKENGWKEGVDYKLRTPTSYWTKNPKTNDWNEIAHGHEINSLLLGYKRGRFTGDIGLSGWAKENKDRWKILQKISALNEEAFQVAYPKKHREQKTFADKYIKKTNRVGIYTALSPNKFNEKSLTKAMSFHIDKGDTKFGFTSMCVFREGNYKGAYLIFPKWGVAIDTKDGDVILADSSELHGVSPIKGKGTRLSCVAYCDNGLATLGIMGKKEKLIGIKKQKERSLEDFF